MDLTERQKKELTSRIRGMIQVLDTALDMLQNDNVCLGELFKQAKESLTPEDRKIFEGVFDE